jgi:anti-sigma factor RsiW
MTCRELADFLLEYCAGELPQRVRTRFERHLGRCPNCREYLAQYQAAVDLGRRAFDDGRMAATAAGVPDELVAAILAARMR